MVEPYYFLIQNAGSYVFSFACFGLARLAVRKLELSGRTTFEKASRIAGYNILGFTLVGDILDGLRGKIDSMLIEDPGLLLGAPSGWYLANYLINLRRVSTVSTS